MEAIRENGSIKAIPYTCSGSRAQFNVAFPTFRRAFAFVKFARRSNRVKVLTMRETPGEARAGTSAMVRIRVDHTPIAKELRTLLEAAYNDDNIGV